MHGNDHLPSDPLGLDAVDREIRLNELRDRLGELGMDELHVEPDCDPAIEEQFLRGMIDYESADWTTHARLLAERGVELPPAESLDDVALSAKLWEVFHALAALSTVLVNTNHLSDRALYEHLQTQTLQEETPRLSPDSGWNCTIDLLGGCSEEDLEIYLRFYADEEYRRHWAEEFPSDPMPPHEDPPFDRDRYLPRSANDRAGECGFDEG